MRAPYASRFEDTIAAFNTRKANAILQAYTRNLDVVTTRGEHLRQRDELEERLEGLFARPDFRAAAASCRSLDQICPRLT